MVRLSKPMDIDLQLFAGEGGGLDFEGLIAELGGESAFNPPADPPADPPPNDPPPNNDPPPTDPPANPPVDPPPAPTGNGEDAKKDYAFAQLRTQNKQLEQIIKTMAEQLGVTETDPTKVQQFLDEKLIALKAKQQGIPEEFMRKFTESERKMEIWNEKRIETENTENLQNVIAEYGLTQEELTGFLQTYYQKGIDPFKVEGLDFGYDYYKANAGNIAQKKIDAAIKAERERVALAAKEATPPTGASNPQNPGAPAKVESIQQLNAFLETMK